MKQILTGHDVVALTAELKMLEEWRVNNVYDITNKMICIKLTKEQEKKYLIMDSGNKFYLKDTPFSAIKKMPSSFCAKLRKHIKNKRIALFGQINMDRVIDIQFGTDEYAYHVIAEFYASGNIILTDSEYKILTLLHPFTYKDDDDRIKVSTGHVYPREYATTNIADVNVKVEGMWEWINTEKVKIEKKMRLKQFLSRSPLAIYGPVLTEHVLCGINIDPKVKVNAETDFNLLFPDDVMEQLVIMVPEVYKSQTGYKGFLFEDTVVPYLYNQYQAQPYTEFETFSEAISVFFSSQDNVKTSPEQVKTDTDVHGEQMSRDERVAFNIQTQIKKIEDDKNEVTENIDNVEEDMNTLQLFLNTIKFCSMKDITTLQNEVDQDELDVKIISIETHLNSIVFEFKGITYKWNLLKSAYGNLTNMYEGNKVLSHKASRATDVLVKLEQDQKKNKKVAPDDKWKEVELEGKKKENWFEQFNWFFSSDGFLVISGKTAEQNETIVKKYMEDHDVYIHSNTPGSGSCIVRNEKNVAEIPPRTLIEAGSFVICHTKAWKDGISDVAWWVNPDQVSKTTETKEFVTKGSFIIRGKKNYMTQPKMELGLGLLFKIKGNPIMQMEAGEDIEYCLPIVSPYAVMNNYKFKVKIVPGTQKIGRVLKEITGGFFRGGNMYEQAGIKKVATDDYHRVLVTGIRVVASKR